MFEANKDQLNDPNDLKQGMTLRIPQSGGESLQGAASTFGSTVILPEPLEAEPPLTNSGSSADTGSIALPPMLPSPGGDERFGPLDDSATPRKFVPARRSPAPERAFEPQSQVNPQHQKSVRRLSQRYSDLQPTTIAR